MKRFLSLAALALLLAPALQAQDTGERWLLVRGASETAGTLPWQRIGDVYLAGRTWEMSDPESASARPATSRLVVGHPASHPLVAELAAQFGVGIEDGLLTYRGLGWIPATGFAMFADDPDGGGSLFLICGPDDASVLSCFQTSLGLQNGAYAIVNGGQVLELGRFDLRFDRATPRVVRLDHDFERLLAESEGQEGEQALRIARGLAGYSFVYGVTDTLPLVQRVLADPSALDRTRAFFADRDVESEILGAWRRCADALGGPTDVAPVFYVLYDDANGTNARGFGIDQITGRRQVLYNLNALARGDHARAAFVHEAVHTFQNLSGTRLVQRVAVEGIATLVSERLVDGLGAADALLWSEEELAAAEARREAIVAAFASVSGTEDVERMREWMTLGVPLSSVDGAPSRCGYYVGWLAARAWLDADPSRDLAALLRAPAEEILGSL